MNTRSRIDRLEQQVASREPDGVQLVLYRGPTAPSRATIEAEARRRGITLGGALFVLPHNGRDEPHPSTLVITEVTT